MADCVDSVGLPMIAGTTLPTYIAKQVADDAASLADAGILFPADSDGTLSPTHPAGILFSAVPAGIPFPEGPVGTLSLSDHAGMLFPAVPPGIPFPAGPDQDGTLSPTDPAGILFPADPAGMLFPAVPVGILIPPDPAGILTPPDPAGILFPADLAEPVTLDVAGSADAGILFPAITAEIPISIGPAGMLFPTDLAELDIVGVVTVAGEVLPAVLDVSDRPEMVAMVVEGEVGTVEGFPVDYSDICDDSEYKDPRNEFETVDGMPVYYGGDFTDSDCEDPRDITCEDWVEWCEFNAPD